MDKDRNSPQGDIYGKNKQRKGGRKLPLRATVAVIAGLIVTFSVLAELVPMTSFWLQTINTFSDTALESLSNEAALYRATVVGRTLEKVNTQISMPVTEAGVLLGIDGQHLLVDKYGARNCGVFDNETDPNMYWYSYNAAGTALNSTIVETTQNYPMVLRDWWVRSHHNEVGGMSWTGPYWSVSPGDGLVLAFTRQVPDPDNPTGPCIAVTLQSYSVKYLSSYFSGLKHTAHGWSMLLNWNMDMIAVTEGYASANPSTKAAYKATASPNATVREIVAEWAAQSGTFGLSATSFELRDLYADTGLITQPGNLTFWLVLVTPKSDFLGDIVQKQVDTKGAIVRIIMILLAVELVVMVIAVGMATFLGDRLVKPLLLVSAQMKKVANMELTGIEGTSSSPRSTIREVSLYVPTIVVRYLVKNKLMPAVGVAPMHATIMFLDVANFSSSMDKYGVTVLIEILEHMFDSFSSIIESNRAIIDKYIGDAIMAVWGCPEGCENSEGLACKAAMELLASLKKMNEEIFVKKYGLSMAIRVGLNSGEVYAGNVGSSSRLNYTVLGNVVNLAARLEPLNKEFNTSCCVADSIRSACHDQYASCISRGG
eukprot:m51a1_g8735 hypothetical protein (598) ;mRNA; f:18420-20639